MEVSYLSYDKEQDTLRAYEQFKLQWMIDHGFTLSDLMEELDKMQEENPDATVSSLFDDWEYGYGFASEVWPCYEEFMEEDYPWLKKSAPGWKT